MPNSNICGDFPALPGQERDFTLQICEIDQGIGIGISRGKQGTVLAQVHLSSIHDAGFLNDLLGVVSGVVGKNG